MNIEHLDPRDDAAFRGLLSRKNGSLKAGYVGLNPEIGEDLESRAFNIVPFPATGPFLGKLGGIYFVDLPRGLGRRVWR